MAYYKSSSTNLTNLPLDVLEKIFSYISFDEVSRCRVVCQKFNAVSKRVLNHGFHRVEKFHAQCMRHVKAQLPRRESERRKHHLSRHCDILTAVETRLSLLGMTFIKFMELNLCCFIPGKVLDELYKVLRYVSKEQVPCRAHEILQELRDLSSMAMEHFDEKICPAFKKRRESGPKITTGHLFSPPMDPQLSANLRAECQRRNHKWKEDITNMAVKVGLCQRAIMLMKLKHADLHKKNQDLEKKVTDLQALVATQVEITKEQSLKIDVLTRKRGKRASLVKQKTPRVSIVDMCTRKWDKPVRTFDSPDQIAAVKAAKERMGNQKLSESVKVKQDKRKVLTIHDMCPRKKNKNISSKTVISIEDKEPIAAILETKSSSIDINEDSSVPAKRRSKRQMEIQKAKKLCVQ